MTKKRKQHFRTQITS